MHLISNIRGVVERLHLLLNYSMIYKFSIAFKFFLYISKYHVYIHEI